MTLVKLEDSSDSEETDLSPTQSQPPKLTTKALIKGLFGAGIGHALEWFDFAIFGLLADELGKAFFPGNNSTIHLISIFALFGGSFLMRPFGGVLFGYIGDKYGRLYSLRISIFMMGIPTFLIGLLPKYQTIGITSTIILIILRLIQGISLGGELTGAITYILEICPQNKRAFYSELVQISKFSGVLASVFIFILRLILNNRQMYKFGWRIPFLFGILVLYSGVKLRKDLQSTNEFLDIKNKNQILKNPIIFLFKNYKTEILIGICHFSFGAIIYYTFYVFTPVYLKSVSLRNEKYKNKHPYLINTLGILCLYPFGILGAIFGDKYSVRCALLISGSVLCVLTVILYPFLSKSNDVLSGVIVVILSIPYGAYRGSRTVFMANLYYNNVAIRNTGLGITYNIAQAIFAGFTPLIATVCIHYMSLVYYCLFIVSPIAVMSLAVMFNKDYIIRKRNKWYEIEENKLPVLLREKGENESDKEVELEELNVE